MATPWFIGLRSEIQLTSPNGKTFKAKWRGNNRSMAKKLGVFEFPGVQGAIVQDLDVGATRYPLTIFFDGLFNDSTSDDFFEECKVNGRWEIIHPTLGGIELQLVSVTERIQPVESGNVTQLDTEWIEPLDAGLVLAAPNLFFGLLGLGLLAGTAAVSQYQKFARTDNAAQVASLDDSTTQSVGLVSKTVNKGGEDGNSDTNAIIAVIEGILSTTPIDVAALGQAMIDLIILGADEADPSVYEKYVIEMTTVSPATPSIDNLPIIATQEVSLSAAIIGFSTAAVNLSLQSRSQAIGLAERMVTLFYSVVDILDETQTLYLDNSIDKQYFSQSEAYSNLFDITSRTVAFLLASSFNLKVEKRFTLTEPKTPINITVEEYGTLGDGDSNLDLFIGANMLKADEILILNAGREVVVYV